MATMQRLHLFFSNRICMILNHRRRKKLTHSEYFLIFPATFATTLRHTHTQAQEADWKFGRNSQADISHVPAVIGNTLQ